MLSNLGHIFGIREQQPVIAVIGEAKERGSFGPSQQCPPATKLHLIGPVLARNRFDHAISTNIPHEQPQSFSQRGRDHLVRPNVLGHLDPLGREIRLGKNLKGIAA